MQLIQKESSNYKHLEGSNINQIGTHFVIRIQDAYLICKFTDDERKLLFVRCLKEENSKRLECGTLSDTPTCNSSDSMRAENCKNLMSNAIIMTA